MSKMSAGIVFLHTTTLNTHKMQHRNTKIIIPNREEPLDEKKKTTQAVIQLLKMSGMVWKTVIPKHLSIEHHIKYIFLTSARFQML